MEFMIDYSHLKKLFPRGNLKDITNYNQLEKFIPKDKLNLEAIPVLMEISEEEVQPILPELLFCIAEFGWPIGTEVLKVLVRFPNSVVPLIKEILKPIKTDNDWLINRYWKYYIITRLIPKLPENSQKLLMEDLQRIIDNPTDDEIYGGVLCGTQDYIKRRCEEPIKKLIPIDKHDFEPIPVLMEISEEEVQPILPELLFWIADINWPIATEMLNVLVRFPDSITPLIKKVLQPTETDEEWKYFIIQYLIPKLPESSQKLLMKDIQRILDSPTDGEIYGEVSEAAKDYMERYYEY